MKFIPILLICLFSLPSFSQTAIKGPWTIECGASSPNAFIRSTSFNLRYISPRFRWSNEDIDEDNPKSEKFKNTRLMVELIYTPPFKVFCAGFNVQSRIVRYKKFSMEIYGGMKLFLVTGTEYTIPNTRGGRKGDSWYLNLGLLWQVDLGMFAPFADIGGDRIITVGTEMHLRKIYQKPQRRYKLLREKN
ncbi:MAG: hypothetical protein KA163_07565 [Bacteroidia bacterium]|nr:hypothetical protein [Bacteroidia bacterium]